MNSNPAGEVCHPAGVIICFHFSLQNRELLFLKILILKEIPLKDPA